MALSAGAIGDVRNGGSATHAAFFNPSNNNFATDLIAASATGNSPVVSSASYSFVAGDVGHFLFVKSGTNWNPGWYPILSVSGGLATIDASIGAAIRYATQLVAPGPNTVAGVATVASPTGGTWGIDYSQQTSPRIAYTDMVIGGTTTQFTSAANPVAKNLVGNHIQVVSGTGFTVGVFEVVSTSGTTATCDRSLGTAASTGGNSNLGGAFGHPGSWSQYRVDGMIGFIKYSATTYDITSSTAAINGGRVVYGAQNKLIGWDTVRSVTNRDANRPTIKSTVASITMVSNVDGFARKVTLRNLILDGNSQTSNNGLSCSDTVAAYNVCVKRCPGNGFTSLRDGWKCEADQCGTGFLTPIFVRFCTSRRNTSHGFNASGASCSLEHCIAAGNGGNGFTTALFYGSFSHCTSYGNTGAGFLGAGDDRGSYWYRCVAYGNGTYGWDTYSTQGNSWLIQCAGGANTTANVRDASVTLEDFVTLTADPFVNAAGGDFSLNNVAGGGAALRWISQGFPGISTTHIGDLGAVQHQETAGGGGAPMIGSRIGGVLL